MMTVRGYKVELDLNNQQKTACLKHAGASRWAYNWGLKRYQEEREAGRKAPTAISLHKELNVLKQGELGWMYEVSKCAPQEALRNLEAAMTPVEIDALACQQRQVKRRSLKQEPNSRYGLSIHVFVSGNGLSGCHL